MWLYNGTEVDDALAEQYVGFVYRITNLQTGRQYLGKKLFKNTRTKKVKGQTRRKKTKLASDWKSYYGSNSVLKEDVQTLGAENFKREILKFCTSKGSLNYWELKYQVIEGALESDKYYNDWIMVRVHRTHIKDIFLA